MHRPSGCMTAVMGRYPSPAISCLSVSRCRLVSNALTSIWKHEFRITNQSCLNLNSVAIRSGCAAFLAAALAASAHAWTVTSRELVDLEYASDQSLRILISAPGAALPGLYRWRPQEAQPTLICRINAPATFSFDRSLLIENVSGEQSLVRLYQSSNCRTLATLRLDGRVMDVDARGRQIAVAVRLPDSRYELRLYSRRGRLVATTPVGRNVEVGFAPDGRSLVNFDLSDRGVAHWRIPTLATLAPAAWLNDGETTFVPGSAFVKRYVNDALSVASWPGGKILYSVPASRAVRLRELSANGRFGALQERHSDGESLEWIDLVAGRRVPLASGSIDHATINAAGNAVSWSVRDAVNTNQVHVSRSRVAVDGTVTIAKD